MQIHPLALSLVTVFVLPVMGQYDTTTITTTAPTITTTPKAATTSSSPLTSSSPTGGDGQGWGLCGGLEEKSGITTCPDGWFCAYANQFFSQCLPLGGTPTTLTTTTATTTTTTTTKAATSPLTSSNTSKTTSKTTKTATTVTTAPVATVTQYGQCGGQGYTGPTICASPYTCYHQSVYYWQCL